MDRFKNLMKTPKIKYILLTLIIVLAGWGLIRGCSGSMKVRHPIYHIGIDPNWYPLSLYGKNKNLQAFIDELFAVLRDETGLRFNLVQVGSSSLITGLDNNNYDGAITSIPNNPYNLIKYQFSDPIYLLGPVLVVTTHSKIQSLHELEGKFIGISRGSSLNFDVPIPKSNIKPYDNMTVALADLDDDKIDGVIIDAMQAFVQLQGIYAGKLKIVSRPLFQDGLRLTTLKNPKYDEMISLFNTSLKIVKENGTYDQLLSRWGLYNPLINNPIKN